MAINVTLTVSRAGGTHIDGQPAAALSLDLQDIAWSETLANVTAAVAAAELVPPDGRFFVTVRADGPARIVAVPGSAATAIDANKCHLLAADETITFAVGGGKKIIVAEAA